MRIGFNKQGKKYFFISMLLRSSKIDFSGKYKKPISVGSYKGGFIECDLVLQH